MPTKNPRINITIEETIVKVLEGLAKQEKKSLSLFAKELILDALEHREDIAFSTLAQVREAKSTKTISHEDAWKN